MLFNNIYINATIIDFVYKKGEAGSWECPTRRPLVDEMLSPATSVNSIENTSRDSPAKETFQDKCTEADTPAEAQYLCPVKCCSDDHDSSNICCRVSSASILLQHYSMCVLFIRIYLIQFFTGYRK